MSPPGKADAVSELVFLKYFPALRRKKSENQDFSRRKGVDILTYIKPDNTEKDDFQVF